MPEKGRPRNSPLPTPAATRAGVDGLPAMGADQGRDASVEPELQIAAAPVAACHSCNHLSSPLGLDWTCCAAARSRRARRAAIATLGGAGERRWHGFVYQGATLDAREELAVKIRLQVDVAGAAPARLLPQHSSSSFHSMKQTSSCIINLGKERGR